MRGRLASPPIERRLACRTPFDGKSLLGFLGARAVPGVESVEGLSHRRSLALPCGAATVELKPEPEGGRAGVRCRLRLADLDDLDVAVACCRRLLDLDADPGPVQERLGADPVLGALVRRRPGLRVPGCADGFELAVRAIVGQQVSVAGARTVLGRMAAQYGEPLGDGKVARLFPRAATLATVDPGAFPFPRSRGEALRTVARLVCEGELDLDAGADPKAARAALLAVKGIGPWTAAYIAMRAFGDPDAWLPGDVGVRNALERLGQPADNAGARQLSEAWRPSRSYAVVHLWASL